MTKIKTNEKISLIDDQNHIDPSNYSAITLDTSIIQKTGYKFDVGVLPTLKNQLIPVVLSKIVDSEIINHLLDRRDKTLDQLKSVIKDLQKHQIISDDELNKMQSDAENFSKKDPCMEYEKFKTNARIKIIEANNCDMDKLVTTYFKSHSPFDQNKNKNEFPDAIALLSLEGWAKKNGKIILAISDDRQWQAYSVTSDHIHVVKDLAICLDKIQISVDEIKKKIGKLIISIRNAKNQALTLCIETFLFDILPMADSTVDYDDTQVLGTYIEDEVLETLYCEESFIFPEDSKLDLLVLSSSKIETKFIVTLLIGVTASAQFTQFYNEDRELVKIGDIYKDVNADNVPIRVVFTLKGNVLEDNYIPNISNISIDGYIYISFGNVELFSDDTPDDPF